jgi:cobalt-zinc-cadmium efflux system outer membrane protein
MAVPDVTIGSAFDQHSSYANNYVGLTNKLALAYF